MIEIVILLVSLANLAMLLYNKRSMDERISRLERVGVLVTADSKVEINAKPMSPREKIRWYERRMNGSLRVTP